MKKLLSKFPALLLTLIVGLIAAPSAFGSATIVIENADAPNVGFNDPTPATPVGGNGGTTLGEQRLVAFRFAAGIWGATLNSGPTITIHAQWSALTCTTNTAVLGAAGAATVRANFLNAPVQDTWYGAALANAIAGSDSNTSTAEINANFNINLGNAGCFDGRHWYLGLDGNHGADVDLVSVLLHEFAHGLGFQTFTDASNGQQLGSTTKLPSIYDRFLLDTSTGKTWVQMTDAERTASAINTGKLVWIGPQATADAPNVLGNPFLRVNSPASVAGNYSIGTADFGPGLTPSGISANIVQAFDPSDSVGASTTDGCSALTNTQLVAGKIALIDRGSCTFVSKVKNAQNAGAVGVIIVDNTTNTIPPGMGGSDSTIVIPTVSITQSDGSKIKAQLAATVNASLLLDRSSAAGADASGHPLLYTPNPFASGSSVSHWDTSAFPNQLMEPNNSADLSHSVTMPKDLTASLLQDLGWTLSTSAQPSTVQFTASNFPVTENAGSVTISVQRTGDASAAASVSFATSDTSGLIPCNQNSAGKASERCDYGTSLGTLSWAAGDTSVKSFTIPIIDDALVEGSESFTVTLSNAAGATIAAPTATVTISDDSSDTASAPNPIDGVDFFITQQYIDFLGRLPDQGGFINWHNTLAPCPNGGFGENDNPSCDRIHVAAGFFQSAEFLDRGYWAFRIYMVGLGQRPTYAQFIPDMAQVGGPKSPTEENAAKNAFASAFAQRLDSDARYRGLTGQAFANALLQTAGLSGLSYDATGKSNGTILREIAETSAAFNKFLVDGTVAIQYFAFLRRDPDATGYQNNVNTLRADPNNLRHMIFIFIYSDEYRGRFGKL